MSLSIEESTTTESSYCQYKTTLVNKAGVPIALADVVKLTLTFADADGIGSIINGREDQDVLNLEGVTIAATGGLLTWDLLSDDNPIINALDPGELERHRATFELVYDVDKTRNWTVDIYVENLEKVLS